MAGILQQKKGSLFVNIYMQTAKMLYNCAIY